MCKLPGRLYSFYLVLDIRLLGLVKYSVLSVVVGLPAGACLVFAYGVLCDLRVPLKLKDKFYRIAIRPAMLYGAECWPTKMRHLQQLSVAELHILR
jgi:hypothetical protein